MSYIGLPFSTIFILNIALSVALIYTSQEITTAKPITATITSLVSPFTNSNNR